MVVQGNSGKSMRYLYLSKAPTHAGLDVESIAPGAVISAVDGDLTFAGAGVTPVFSGAEILDGGGIGTGVDSVRPSPVVSAQIIVLHRERRHSTVDGCREEECILIICRGEQKNVHSRMQAGMTLPPCRGIGLQVASSAHST